MAMIKIFGDLKYVAVYIEDIAILSDTQEEHERAEKLMSRYGRKSIFWRLWNIILDFFDRLFKR